MVAFRKGPAPGISSGVISETFGLTKLVTDGCVHIKYMNNKKTRKESPTFPMADLANHLAPFSFNDRIYPDCPHANVILIPLLS